MTTHHRHTPERRAYGRGCGRLPRSGARDCCKLRHDGGTSGGGRTGGRVGTGGSTRQYPCGSCLPLAVLPRPRFRSDQTCYRDSSLVDGAVLQCGRRETGCVNCCRGGDSSERGGTGTVVALRITVLYSSGRRGVLRYPCLLYPLTSISLFRFKSSFRKESRSVRICICCGTRSTTYVSSTLGRALGGHGVEPPLNYYRQYRTCSSHVVKSVGGGVGGGGAPAGAARRCRAWLRSYYFITTPPVKRTNFYCHNIAK